MTALSRSGASSCRARWSTGGSTTCCGAPTSACCASCSCCRAALPSSCCRPSTTPRGASPCLQAAHDALPLLLMPAFQCRLACIDSEDCWESPSAAFLSNVYCLHKVPKAPDNNHLNPLHVSFLLPYSLHLNSREDQLGVSRCRTLVGSMSAKLTAKVSPFSPAACT